MGTSASKDFYKQHFIGRGGLRNNLWRGTSKVTEFVWHHCANVYKSWLQRWGTLSARSQAHIIFRMAGIGNKGPQWSGCPWPALIPNSYSSAWASSLLVLREGRAKCYFWRYLPLSSYLCWMQVWSLKNKNSISWKNSVQEYHLKAPWRVL